MKRSWFGAILLILLLGLGIWSQWRAETLNAPIVEALHKAQSAAAAENWEQAEKLIKQAEDHWHSSMDIRAAVCDHTYLEQINAGFASLEVWQDTREATAASALCAELASQIDALIEAQKLSWRNVL